MASTFLKFVNRMGIPTIESVGKSITPDAAEVLFKKHNPSNFAGLIIAKVREEDTLKDAPADLPVHFKTEGVSNSSKPLFMYENVTVTVTEWLGAGIYLLFYDSDTGKLHLLMNLL